MADLKISQLTGATTPLAGTEVLPIVQSGATKKATVNQILSPAAGNGINFTANTPAAGMTSQLLNWYEEGTWTPALEADGQSGTYTYTTQTGRYTRIGNTVYGTFKIVWTALPSVGAATRVVGLPFAWNSSYDSFGASATYISGVPHTDGLYMPMGTTGGGTRTAFKLFSDGSVIINTTTGNNLSASGTLMGTFMYVV